MIDVNDLAKNIGPHGPQMTAERVEAAAPPCTLTDAQVAALRGEWGTPGDLARVVWCEFGPSLDVAASAANSLCRHFYDAEHSALDCDWSEGALALARTGTKVNVYQQHGASFWNTSSIRNRVAWCNPPHDDFWPWAAKCREQVVLGHVDEALLLCLPSFSSAWWREHVKMGADEVRLLEGRVQFVPPPLLVQAGLVEGDAAKNDRERCLVIFRRQRTTVPGAPRIWSWDWRRALDVPTDKEEIEE